MESAQITKKGYHSNQSSMILRVFSYIQSNILLNEKITYPIFEIMFKSRFAIDSFYRNYLLQLLFATNRQESSFLSTFSLRCNSTVCISV